jgi:serine/threonine-protein kinase RsbT
MEDEVLVPILSDVDLVAARAQSRALAERLGFSRTDATLIATAISEVARNIIVHAGRGEIQMRPVYEEERHGLVVVARDSGPGMRDVRRALEASLASRGGLGLGLPGVRRLMDEFEIDSEPGEGTTVRMTKWRIRDELERLRERRRRRTSAGMEEA